MGVQRIEITSREPVFEGRHFGADGRVGPYELLSGKAHCVIDPSHALNRDIVNLVHAPRNAQGLVEYAVDFHIYKPLDLARGNGWQFYEYLNRGTQRGIVRIQNAPVVALPKSTSEIGNGFLMHEGYTIVWSAWQGNVEPGGGRMLASFPVARRADGPIVGTGWEEFILDAPDSIRGAFVSETSAHSCILTLSYPAADLDVARASLSARQYEGDARTLPDGVSWRYLDENRIEVTRSAACTLDRGALFEFLYPARDPVVMGLGYASVRDVMDFFKHAGSDAHGTANPLAQAATAPAWRAMGFGLSQSGRVLRDFLYEGFNETLGGQRVFDAVVPIIAGSRRAWINAPFSQPGRYARQHEDHSYPGDQFPFAYAQLHDPLTGRDDSILRRARLSHTSPKVMHLDTDSEVWSARASLVVTDGAGRDLPVDPDVRFYLTTGVAHGDYPLPTGKVVEYATNPLTYGFALRALFVAMRAWVDEGVEPPPSRFPSHASGTWWTPELLRERFEQHTGLPAPQAMNVLRVLDHSTVPPRAGAAYQAYVPAVDADGNGVDGIRHPLLAAPLGTHAGWALRAPGYAAGALYSVYGSYMPFAAGTGDDADAGARVPSNDRRPTLTQRYGGPADWRQAVRLACETLVQERLMLAADADHLLRTVDALLSEATTCDLAVLSQPGAAGADVFHVV